MKRTCYKCRALCDMGRHSHSFCSLGYKIKNTYYTITMSNKSTESFPETIPQEECPKPLTFKKLFELRRLDDESITSM